MSRRKLKRPADGGPRFGLAALGAGERAQALRRERERLLNEIGQRRRELEKALTDIQAATTEIGAALAPILAKQSDIEDEIHVLFNKLLAPGRLAKRKRAKIRNIYNMLDEVGLITLRDHAHFDEPPHPPDGDGFDGEPTRVRSASRPPEGDEHRTLRSLFKRLVVALHPDRARQADEVAHRTAAMKEVTQAYESGDLAQLIALDERLTGDSTSESANIGSEPSDALARIVAELKTQLRRLLDELRALRRSDEFRAAKDLQRMQKNGEDPIAMLTEEEEATLDDLVATRDFVAAFEAGKTTFADFIRGPSLSANSPEDLKQEFEELIDQVFVELASLENVASPPSRRRHARPRRRSDPIPF